MSKKNCGGHAPPQFFFDTPSFGFDFDFDWDFDWDNPIFLTQVSVLNVKNFERVQKRSWSQIIDLVITIQTVQESSKSELSSGGRGPFKVFFLRRAGRKS